MGKKKSKDKIVVVIFFHQKIKNQIKNKIKDLRDFKSRETFDLTRLLISLSKL